MRRLMRPVEVVIERVACALFGHFAVVHLDLVIRCRRCGRALGRLPFPVDAP
jgi:hypothetical protein